MAGVIVNGRTRNPLPLTSVPVRVHYVGVWVRMPADPPSDRLRKATTTLNVLAGNWGRLQLGKATAGLPQSYKGVID